MSDYYASAELNEEDEMRPIEFSLDGVSAPGPYTTSIQNIFSRHCAEIRTNSEIILAPIQQVSRKKIRELISRQNNDIFGFLQRPDRTPHPSGIAESIFRRYGHDMSNLHKNTQPVSKDLLLDVSMNSTANEFEKNLQKMGGTTLQSFMGQLKWIFSQYKSVGEEILRVESVLIQKMDMLDKLHQRTPILTSLKANPMLPELLDSFGKYLEHTFKESNIEETYKQLGELYKKWHMLREIVSLQLSTNDTTSTEPICGICLTESIHFAVVPCGHTFCSTCSRKMNISCYLCRGTIREKVKLFFS